MRDRTRGLRDEADGVFESGRLDYCKPGDRKAGVQERPVAGGHARRIVIAHLHGPTGHTVDCWDTRALDVGTDSGGVVVRPLASAADADAFRALNEEWISRDFVVDERDRRQLDNPLAAYVDTGGAILIAEMGGRAIGCVALVPRSGGAWELSKMAVSPASRGQGVGRKLLEAAISHVQASGARSLFLGSSTKLAAAVRLYETFGFKHVPRETLRLESSRIDVFMELVLE